MDKKNLNIIRKKEPNKEKEEQKKEQKKSVHNDHFKPYKAFDGYMHCNHCRRRYEPGHVCERQYL